MEEVETQLSNACDMIKTRLGKPPLTLAFPFNARTPEIEATALKYHVAYRAHQLGTGGSITSEALNTWADRLVKEKKWGVLMVHGITEGYAAFSDPEHFRTHLKYVKSRGRDVWVDTFANVARYEKERDEAKLTVNGKVGGLTCLLSSPLDPEIYNVPLTIVVAARGIRTVRAERAGQELPARVENGSLYIQAAPNSRPITVAWK